VGRAAGVHPSTASRVINGSGTLSIPAETRERILDRRDCPSPSDLVDCEQAVGAESVVVAGEVVLASELAHDDRVEPLAGAGATAGGVEPGGCLAVRVVVKELLEQRDRGRVGLALLPGVQRHRCPT
jgi:hypothetical protein